jgi:hypothetical protein
VDEEGRHDLLAHQSNSDRLRHAISELIVLDEKAAVEHILDAIPFAAQRALLHRLQKEPDVSAKRSEVHKGLSWERWRDHAGDEILETMVDEIEKWMEARYENADRVTALIFLFLEVFVGFWVLTEYFSSHIPEGHWFFCKVPFLLSVVSYKPFAIPMWACITVICPYTFAENVFGHHPKVSLQGLATVLVKILTVGLSLSHL